MLRQRLAHLARARNSGWSRSAWPRRRRTCLCHPGASSAASATTVSPISWSDDGARCTRRPAGATRRIVGDDLDAALHRLLQRRHQRVGIVGRDRDGVDVLGDQRVEHFDLAFGGRRGRAGVDDFGVEFRGGFLGALVDGIEEAVAERFGDHAHARARRLRGFALAAAGKPGLRPARRTRPRSEILLT